MLFIQPYDPKKPTKVGAELDIVTPYGQVIGRGKVYSVGIEMLVNIPFNMMILAGLGVEDSESSVQYEVLLVELRAFNPTMVLAGAEKEVPHPASSAFPSELLNLTRSTTN